MKSNFTQSKFLRLAFFLFLAFPLVSSLSGQVGTSFEGIPTNLNCMTSSGCNYNDPGSAVVVHALMDNNGIPVSQMGSGSTLGFVNVFTPTRIGDPGGTFANQPLPGLTDNQRFGVAGNVTLNNQLSTAPGTAPDGVQAFFVEDTDGEVEMTFDAVNLTGTTNPMFSFQYYLDGPSFEESNGANDRFYARIVIDNCAAATTITLLDTDGGGIDGGVGGDIDALNIKGSWRTLSANLTAYVGCRATLILEFDFDATSEELGIDNIVFTQGARDVPVTIVCPTVGAVSPSDNPVCVGDPFNITATGLANMASADNLEQNFGIEFKYFSSATADPYTGGTSLGTVPFGSLTAGNTTAALVGASLPSPDPSGFIYAVLSPTPTALTCRPSATTIIAVEPTPVAPVVEDVNSCGESTVLIIPGGTSPTPVQFWTEEFAENGAGVTGACSGADPATCMNNVAPSNGQWSIAGDASGLADVSDFFQVSGGELIAQDLDSELCFLSPSIDIFS